MSKAELSIKERIIMRLLRGDRPTYRGLRWASGLSRESLQDIGLALDDLLVQGTVVVRHVQGKSRYELAEMTRVERRA